MKVSIITVCLNARHFIDKAVGSVLSQDYPDLEYIIVDGGSTDGTFEFVMSVAEQDKRLTVYSGEDQGIADAMNRGVERSTGQLFAHLHADDSYATQTAVSTVVAELKQRSDAQWLTGGIREIDENGCRIREIRPRRFSFNRLMRNNIILHPATFIRRTAFDAVGGFDAGLRYAMDYDLWLRLAKVGHSRIVDDILTCFRVHSGSLSSANRLSALEEEYLVRQRYLGSNGSGLFHACYQWYRRRGVKRGV